MNLIDNWDFRGASPDPLLSAVVNQRGRTKYVSDFNTYTIDRWRMSRSMSHELHGGFLRCKREREENITFLSQMLEFPHLYSGKTLTMSIIYRSNSDKHSLGINGAVEGWSQLPASQSWVLESRTFTLIGNMNFDASGFGVTASANGVHSKPGDYMDIQAVKLELGTVSTLANDPPMDFGRELAVCQRHQINLRYPLGATRNLANVLWMDTRWIVFQIPLPTTMRITPIISGINSTFEIIRVTNGMLAGIVTGFAFSARLRGSNLIITTEKANHGLTNALLRSTDDGDSSIIADANL